jgi:hypothetical protein
MAQYDQENVQIAKKFGYLFFPYLQFTSRRRQHKKFPKTLLLCVDNLWQILKYRMDLHITIGKSILTLCLTPNTHTHTHTHTHTPTYTNYCTSAKSYILISTLLDSFRSATSLCSASSVLMGTRSEPDCVCTIDRQYNSGVLVRGGGLHWW